MSCCTWAAHAFFKVPPTLKCMHGSVAVRKACQSFISSLFWSMVLLLIFMVVGALIIGNILQNFIQDSTADFSDRQWVWYHYGTAYRSWLTLYELTFSGSWPSSTRPVLDKVSQGFIVFFVLYITVIAFALIRIITAVFLKDTLDAANNDAELQTLENMQRQEKSLFCVGAGFLVRPPVCTDSWPNIMQGLSNGWKEFSRPSMTRGTA